MTDILLVLAFINREIVPVQPSDQPVHGIGNRYRNKHEVHVGLYWRRMRFERGIGEALIFWRGSGLNAWIYMNVIDRALRKTGSQQSDTKKRKKGNSTFVPTQHKSLRAR